MESKNEPLNLDDLLFVWNHIHDRFRKQQAFNLNYSPKPDLTKDQLDEKEQEKEKQFTHLRCILLLILSKMLKTLSKNGNHVQRDQLILDLKRLVRINDEKNQLLIHMACQKECVIYELHRLYAERLLFIDRLNSGICWIFELGV